MAHKGTNGKGDLVNKTKGVTINEYARVHRWINYHYGKANKCENKECNKVSKNYQWALRKNCKYEKLVENFISLCVSCHKKYDWKPEYTERLRQQTHSDETKEKIRQAHTGKKISEEHKAILSKRFSGSGNPMYGISIKDQDSAWFGKKHSDDSKKKMCLSKSRLTVDEINKIREMVGNGTQQKEVAVIFGISRAAICRLINKKRYKNV